MQLRAVAALLECDVMCGHEMLDIHVFSCFAADLMSDVLAFASPHALLVTGLTTVQAVHAANVADCKAVLFVSAKRPAPDALEMARSAQLPLLVTGRPMFEACGVLLQHGLPAARRT